MSNRPSENRSFIVATPQRSVCDDNARALERSAMLRFIALGTRRGTAGVPPERTRLNPFIGLWTYAAVRVLPPFRAESFRFSLLPWFDRWVLKQMRPGDHIISSYGYANDCFKFSRRTGGKTFVDAGNSHIDNFWETISEEHQRWKCPTPPLSRQWLQRSREMLPEVDYVLSPSSYVTKSYLDRGFPASRILSNIYPVDLSRFRPSQEPRPKNRSLTIISTSSLSLRKGSPYLLEAFRLVRHKVPDAQLKLTRLIQDDFKPLLAKFRDLPIEWMPPTSHSEMPARLHSGDVFVLPSLEEGLARAALEAMACGLQVVLTDHTGANDFVQVGRNGEIVPIRSPNETADSILKCWERIRNGAPLALDQLQQRLSFKQFETEFIGHLQRLGLANGFGH